MRYFALILLAVFTLYLLLFKPLLERHRVEFGIEDVSFSSGPLGFKVGDLFFQIKAGGRTLFVGLRNFSFLLGERVTVGLGEGNVIVIEETLPEELGAEGPERGEGKEPPKPKGILIPSFVKDLNVTVGNFTLTLMRDSQMFLHFYDLNLKNRRLDLKGEILTGSDEISFVVDGLVFEDEAFLLKSFELSSSVLDLKVVGKVKEGDLTGNLNFEGLYRGLDVSYVVIPPVRFRGSGNIDGEGIHVSAVAETKSLKVMDRLYKKVESSARGSYKFDGTLDVRGRIYGEDVEADFHFNILPDQRLRVYVHRLLVDSQLAGVPFILFGWVKGTVDLDLAKGYLDVVARSDYLNVESLFLGRAEANFHYSLTRGLGELTVYGSGLGDLALNMNFGTEGLDGQFSLRDLYISRPGISVYLSGLGEFGFGKGRYLSFQGRLERLYSGPFPVGDADLSLGLKGDQITGAIKGDGFTLSAKGVVGSSIYAEALFRDFERSVYGYKTAVKAGSLKFEGWTDRMKLKTDLRGVSIRGGNLEIEGDLSGEVMRDGELEGDLKFVVRKGNFGERDLAGSLVSMVLDAGRGSGIYYLKDTLSGNYIIDLGTIGLVTNGVVLAGKGELSYTFYGNPQKGHLSFGFDMPFRGSEIRLRGKAHYEGKRFEVILNQEEWEVGIAKVGFGGLRFVGNEKKGEVRFGGLSVSIVEEPLVTVEPSDGILDISRGNFSMDLTLRGPVKGKVNIRYDREKGPFLSAEGGIDLSKLSMFTFTPLGGRAEGSVEFRATYDGNNAVVELFTDKEMNVYSRYFSYPMLGWIEVRGLNRDLSAFLTLWRKGEGISVNLGSSGLKDMYVYLISKNAPVAFRQKGIEGDFRITSEGWIRVSNLKKVSVNANLLLGGEISVKEIKGSGDSGGSGPGAGGGTGKPAGPEVNLDIRFATERPLRVSLPEGYIFTKVKGWVGGKASDPDYTVVVEFVSGELKYFGRKFYVRGGSFSMYREQGTEEKTVNLLIANTSEDLTIFLNLKGDLNDPSLFVWSEPPMNTREILSRLIIGSTAEGFFPVAEGLFKAFGSIGELRSGLSQTLGVDITLSTQTGSSGDLGFNVNIRKKLGRILSIEYQQSTLRDPRSTYFGGSIRLPGGLRLYGRSFSDDTSEVKLKIQRKFDF